MIAGVADYHRCSRITSNSFASLTRRGPGVFVRMNAVEESSWGFIRKNAMPNTRHPIILSCSSSPYPKQNTTKMRGPSAARSHVSSFFGKLLAFEGLAAAISRSSVRVRLPARS